MAQKKADNGFEGDIDNVALILLHRLYDFVPEYELLAVIEDIHRLTNAELEFLGIKLAPEDAQTYRQFSAYHRRMYFNPKLVSEYERIMQDFKRRERQFCVFGDGGEWEVVSGGDWPYHVKNLSGREVEARIREKYRK